MDNQTYKLEEKRMPDSPLPKSLFKWKTIDDNLSAEGLRQYLEERADFISLGDVTLLNVQQSRNSTLFEYSEAPSITKTFNAASNFRPSPIGKLVLYRVTPPVGITVTDRKMKRPLGQYD